MAVLRACDAALQTFLQQSNEFAKADLYTFTLPTGAVLRLTNWDVDLTSGGNKFSSAQPIISRTRARFSNDLTVDQVDVTLAGDLSNPIVVTPPLAPPFALPLPQAIEGGWFRGARVLIQKLIMPYVAGVPKVAYNPIWWFSGQVGQIDFDPLKAKITVVSDLYVINNYLPKALTQAGCRWRLYDAGCTINPASFAFGNTVGAGSGQLVIIPGTPFGVGTPDGYFDQGKVTFTSGQNKGITRTIKQQVIGKLFLNVVFPFPLNNGDVFTAYAGCDKLMSTCQNKFNNLINFGGQPFIPNPETAF